MNIFNHEVKLSLKSIPVYVIVLGIFLLIFLGFYPSFAHDSAQMLKMIENFPKEVITAMGIDLNSLLSYNGYVSYIFLYISIILAIAGMNLGLIAFSREHIDKTSDFLLTKPVSRVRLAITKIIGSVFTLVILNALVTGLILFLSDLMITDKVEVSSLILVCIGGLIISLMFASIGFLLANLFRIKNTSMTTAGVVSLMYLMTMLTNLTKDEKFGWFTPFKYFDFPHIMQNKGFDQNKLIAAISVIVIFSLISVLIYKRRDIKQI